MNMKAGCLIALGCVVFTAHAQQLRVDPRGATVEVQLSVTPASGYCPYTANATWSATGASVCAKSGYWTGSATPSGSTTIEVSATSATFTLTCSANTDHRDLTWSNPTQNVDGSTAKLTGNKVFHASSATALETATPILITPAATTYRVTGLPAGARQFAVKAVGEGNSESALSNAVSATIALPSGAKTVQVGCTTPPPPQPPTGVTVASTVWEYVIKGQGLAQRHSPGRDVGVIEMDTLCIGRAPVIEEKHEDSDTVTGYWVVPRAEVKLYRKPKSNVLLGRCELRDDA